MTKIKQYVIIRSDVNASLLIFYLYELRQEQRLMNRIDEQMRIVRAEGRRALVSFVVTGDPSIEFTKNAIRTMQSDGADVIVAGVPFSDPSADALSVQAADERALAKGTDVSKVLEMIGEIREEIKLPVVLHLYFNVIVQTGAEEFFKRCAQCGIDGIIIPDLPYEESDEIAEYVEKYNVYQIFMVSTASGVRMQDIVEHAKGFLYCITPPDAPAEVYKTFFDRIRGYSDIGMVAVAEVESVERIWALGEYANGVLAAGVIATELEKGDSEAEKIEILKNTLAELKSGI